MVKTVDTALALLKEGLELWKTFIATRQEAYNRKQDKKQERAIQAGEEAIELLSDIFTYIFFLGEHTKDKQFLGYKKDYLRIKKRFNKYD